MDVSNNVIAGVKVSNKYSKLDGHSSNVSVQNSVSTPSTLYKNPSVQNLQAYYVPHEQSFGRLKIEHLRNGAYVDEAKNVFFKLFTFPEVEKVFVEVKNKGLQELKKVEDGIFQKKVSKEFAKHGDDYRFKLVHANGNVTYCKDPYAMRCKDLTDGYAQIYDHHEFKWNDDAWVNNKVPEKISRLSGKAGSSNNLTGLNKLKIYEGNIPTLTREGNFEAAKAKIDELAKDKTFNAIHIMPVESTYSYNWGYDGVMKFAPQESQMGGPDKLKELINYAHSKKINVIMDVVPNHVGPDCNDLQNAAPYLKQGGPFGDSFNLEGDYKNNIHVRDYLSNACLNWLDNYHCDGLRLDMTKFVSSDYTLKQMAMEVHYHHPDAVMIAEDGRENMYKLTQPLSKNEEGVGKSQYFHAEQIKDVDNQFVSLDNLGYDSEWDFPFIHSLRAALDGSGSMSQFNAARKGSHHRMKCYNTHDEQGNMDGTREICKLAANRLNMFYKIAGNGDCEKGQRAAHATQAVLESKVSGVYDKMTKYERMEFLKKHYVTSDIIPEDVTNVLNYALSQDKVGAGATFTTPGGPKMVFQGDENANLSYFKFFRQFSPGNAAKDVKDLSNKGYESGISAFMDSKLDSIPYSKEYKQFMDKRKQFSKDLASLMDNNEVFQDGQYVDENDVVHEFSRVLGNHIKKGNKEVFTINNFKDASYEGNYGIKLPKGSWREVMNSNSSKYGGNGRCQNGRIISSNGSDNSQIALPANSLLIFEKVG